AGSAAAGKQAGILTADVTEPDAGERIVEECQRRFGVVDVLVNGAGTSSVRSLDELTDADWQGQWELHVMAPMRLMRAAAPAMAARGWGRLVRGSSSSGKRPWRRSIAYWVTAGAELSLARAFASVYAPMVALREA